MKNPFDENKITIAKTLAENNSLGAPFSACIYYQGIYYWEVNRTSTQNNPTSHAEICAISHVCKLLGLYTLKGADILCSGEPCGMCLNAIAWAGIENIYYIDDFKVATKKGYKYDCDSKKLNKFLKLNINIAKII
jgi:tRNA(Arg) A34 adenosine deaminase TadA